MVKDFGVVLLRRVSYGRSDTLVKDREYVSNFSSAVGTKKEWREWAKKNKKKVVFSELPANKIYVNNLEDNNESPYGRDD